MKYFLSIAKQTISNSIATMLIYRANLIFFFLFESMFLAGHFITTALGFRYAGGSIAGWSAQEAFLLTGIASLTHQIFVCFFINPLFMLPQHVWSGQFDYILTKPLHPLFSAAASSEVAISNIPNLIINFCVVVYLLFFNKIEFNQINIVFFIAAIAFSIAVRVAFALLCVAPVFFSERLAGVEDSYWSVSSLGRYPLSVYPKWISKFLTFILPMGAIAYVPAGILYQKLTINDFLVSVIASTVFCFICYKFFMLSMRNYQSVNSGV